RPAGSATKLETCILSEALLGSTQMTSKAPGSYPTAQQGSRAATIAPRWGVERGGAARRRLAATLAARTRYAKRGSGGAPPSRRAGQERGSCLAAPRPSRRAGSGVPGFATRRRVGGGAECREPAPLHAPQPPDATRQHHPAVRLEGPPRPARLS